MRRQKAADKETQIREKPRRLQENNNNNTTTNNRSVIQQQEYAVMLRLIVADGLVHPREVHLLLLFSPSCLHVAHWLVLPRENWLFFFFLFTRGTLARQPA